MLVCSGIGRKEGLSSTRSVGDLKTHPLQPMTMLWLCALDMLVVRIEYEYEGEVTYQDKKGVESNKIIQTSTFLSVDCD